VIIEELWRDYKLRYIRKRYLRVSSERHGILQTIQKRYLETRKPVQIEDVRFAVDTYAFPIRLYRIVQKTDTIYNFFYNSQGRNIYTLKKLNKHAEILFCFAGRIRRKEHGKVIDTVYVRFLDVNVDVVWCSMKGTGT
jgi:hypothetical protein